MEIRKMNQTEFRCDAVNFGYAMQWAQPLRLVIKAHCWMLNERIFTAAAATTNCKFTSEHHTNTHLNSIWMQNQSIFGRKRIELLMLRACEIECRLICTNTHKIPYNKRSNSNHGCIAAAASHEYRSARLEIAFVEFVFPRLLFRIMWLRFA